MSSDIPECSCTKKCIHDRMDQNIRIRMAQKTFFPGNINTTKDQLVVSVGTNLSNT